MKYDHELWDTIMTLMDYAERKLEAHGNGVMLAEVRSLHEQAMNEFSLHKDQIMWFLSYLGEEHYILPAPGMDSLTEAEVEATQGDIKASSTKEGKRAVEEAQKRLGERVRLAPVLEAQEKLKQVENARKEKELAVQLDKEKRDRPKRELDEARKAEKAAGDEVKKAEASVKE